MINKVIEPEQPGSAAHILVADDNVMNQDLMANLLDYYGFSFVVVSNGKEVVAQIEHTQFDLVLMDIQMPEMDGYSATAYIRSVIKSDVPVIAMTAHAMTGEREKCLSLGMNGYISKPVNEQELLDLISQFAAQGTPPVVAGSSFVYLELDYLKDMGRGSCAYERKMTSHFVQRIPCDMDGLHTALKNDDYQSVSKIAHSLRTTLAIMGVLPKAVSLLDELEFPAGSRRNCGQLIAALELICDAAVKEAKTFLNSLER